MRALAAVLLVPAVALAQFPIPGPDAGTPDGGEAPWNVNAPPLPGRDVPIDTTEGTWMNVDVSPRGDEVAFDLLGDLYVVPLAGGEARSLTSGPAWDMQPRYSPDGRFLAFTSDRGGGDNLWVLPRDGGVPTPVTKEPLRLVTEPVWTPDSQYVAGRKHFTSRRSLGAGEIWLYHRTGGEGVQLTEAPTQQKDVGEPAFSPDGRFLYFSQDVTPGRAFEYNKDPNGEIYAINRLELATREQVRFVAGPGGSIRPTPSPDGRSLAFLRRVRARTVLMVADVESGAERTLFSGLDRDLQETWAVHGVYPSMAWTPDSRSLVLWMKGGLWRVDATTGDAKPIPFHVRDTRRVFDTLTASRPAVTPTFHTRMLRWAQVSPKGDRVVFESLGRLWVRALPNGQPRRLTTQNEHLELFPAFSRDGASIVYVSWDDAKLGAVRVAPAAGGEGRVVTPKPGHYAEPTFSPDGKHLVFRATTGGGLVSGLFSRAPGLYVVPSAGGAPRRLTTRGESPHFGAETDRVYFFTVTEEEKADVRALESIRLDASEPLVHAKSDEASEYRVSPDGRWLAYRKNFNAFVMPMPKGAKALTASQESKALPVAKVSKDAGGWVHWSGDSKRLHWTLGPQLFTRPLTDAFGFLDGAPEKLPEPPTTGLDLGQDVLADVAKGTVALVGARLITMRGDEVIADGAVVVTDGRIVAVGPRASVALPKGAKVVDVTGKTIIPGLVDVHWHGAIGTEAGLVPEQSWLLDASLAFGVTTVHDPSSDTETFFAAAERQRAGLLTAPRLFSTGTILYGAQGWFRAPVESLEDARAHLRRLKAAGAFSVKSYNQPRRDQRQRLIAAARELGMLVVPEGGSLLDMNLTQVVDGHTGVEHALPVAKLYRDVVQLWSATKTGYTPTLGVAYGGLMGENYWYQTTDVWADQRLSNFVPRRILDARSRRRTKLPDEELNHQNVAAGAKLLHVAGVSVQLGAHGQREGLAAHWELWMLEQGGFTPHEALRVGTLEGARYLGLDQDLGSLEPGKLADLAVLDANPLESLKNSRSVRFTMQGGRLFDAASLDEVWPQPRPRAPFWFQGESGEAWPAGTAEAFTRGHAED
jgi:imidazolonepropionase-like amidohydrolase/Tol biopolymer transport system component